MFQSLSGAVALEPLYDDGAPQRVRPFVRAELMPAGICERRKANVYVASHVKDCAVFLGALNNGEFIPHGTAFFVGMVASEYGIFYLTTAKHVVDQINGDVIARINTKDGGFIYESFPKDRWHFHPDHQEEGRKRKYIDVAVCHVNAMWGNWDFVYIAEDDYCTEDIIKKYTIDTGDEVVVTGMFFSHIGSQKNIPIVRIGNIAAMPHEPVPTGHGLMDAYLIEARSIGGISGSPVFTHMEIRPHTTLADAPGRRPIERSEKPHYLLGLIHGHYTITTQEEWVSKTDRQVGDINAGIAIVVPASKIMETIRQPALFGTQEEQARMAREKTTRRSGSKSDSVPSGGKIDVAPPASDANPNAREDFNSLLGAAVKTRESKD